MKGSLNVESEEMSEDLNVLIKTNDLGVHENPADPPSNGCCCNSNAHSQCFHPKGSGFASASAFAPRFWSQTQMLWIRLTSSDHHQPPTV